MTLIAYTEASFKPSSLRVIEQANEIIAEYEAQGFALTLRQLYYQFVARDLLANTLRNYKNLGEIINKGRMAGLVSWDAIEDRTRNLRSRSHWDTPRDIIDAARRSYHIDLWANQPNRVEVWIEKDALVGVIERVCNRYDVPFFACRGYSSQSEQWRAGLRLQGHIDRGQTPIVLHLGDHDPSGVDMTRDNQDRLTLFAGEDIEVRRLALNIDQVRRYRPPPNPAKFTDSRAAGYIRAFGKSCWELDALDPSLIERLIEDELNDIIDGDLWTERQSVLAADQRQLNDLLAGL
ncbi:MAG TPA: hypothetical protein VEA44_16090 [Caulobacter sp.]|nr:hypothetical protein [Caulobacter sp.]